VLTTVSPREHWKYFVETATLQLGARAWWWWFTVKKPKKW